MGTSPIEAGRKYDPSKNLPELESVFFKMAQDYVRVHATPDDISNHPDVVLKNTYKFLYDDPSNSFKFYVSLLSNPKYKDVVKKQRFQTPEDLIATAIKERQAEIKEEGDRFKTEEPEPESEPGHEPENKELSVEETKEVAGGYALATDLYKAYKDVYTRAVYKELYLIFYTVKPKGSTKDFFEELMLGPIKETQQPYQTKENWGWPTGNNPGDKTAVPPFIAEAAGDRTQFQRKFDTPEEEARALLTHPDVWDSPYFVEKFGLQSFITSLESVRKVYASANVDVSGETVAYAMDLLSQKSTGAFENLAYVLAGDSLKKAGKDPTDENLLKEEITKWEKYLRSDKSYLSVPKNTRFLFSALNDYLVGGKQASTPEFRLVRKGAADLRLYPYIRGARC